MSNSFKFKDTVYKVGDTVTIDYKLKEGEKERIQVFKGILTKIKGDSEDNRMFTVRRISKTGTGVEKVIPLLSPYIAKMELVRKSSYQKSKLYFIDKLTEQEVKTKLYQVKKKSSVKKHKKTNEPKSDKSR